MNGYHAGCNYYVNYGDSPEAPAGTATSMHECGDCEWLEICTVKQEHCVWPLNRVEHEAKIGAFLRQRNEIVRARRESNEG